MALKILVIEDEQDLAHLIQLHLERANFEVKICTDGFSGIQALNKESYDLLVLDLLLPKKNGYQILKEIRKNPQISDLPVILLTALGDKENRLQGLQEGADDYLTKPFLPKELILRIQAILKRTKNQNSILEMGKLTLNKEKEKVLIDSKLIILTKTEFKLLLYFMEKPKIIHSRKNLLLYLGYSPITRSRTLDVHLAKLRSKLGDYSKCLKTIRSQGYQFIQAK